MTAPAVWCWAGTRPDPRLMFAAVPMPDGSHALSWPSGEIGQITPDQWRKFRPFKAGLAYEYGRSDRAMLATTWGAGDAVELISDLVTMAMDLFPGPALAWWATGFMGAAS